MGVIIDTIILGFGHSYIIRDQGVIMIDGGDPKKAKAFVKGMESIALKPEDIKLMIMTHGHFDHIGSAAEIKEISGAKIAMHQQEKDWLEKGLKPLSPGVNFWGSTLLFVMKAFMVPFMRIPPTQVDVILGDEDFSLAEYGIPGKVIYTPGHSSGSVSILLETGDAFVGDLAMNALPMRFSPGLPVFAEDWKKVKESWNLLLKQGAKTIYPAHGKPFSADIIRKALS